MAKPSVFISYDCDHDKACKDRLLAWDTNQEYDFCSYNQSFGVSVDSPEATVIKQDLAAKIADANYFLCLVGRETYRSGWVAWEIRKAIELKKKLLAVKTDSINNSPTAMQGVGASWSAMFNFDSIKSAMN